MRRRRCAGLLSLSGGSPPAPFIRDTNTRTSTLGNYNTISGVHCLVRPSEEISWDATRDQQQIRAARHEPGGKCRGPGRRRAREESHTRGRGWSDRGEERVRCASQPLPSVLYTHTHTHTHQHTCMPKHTMHHVPQNLVISIAPFHINILSTTFGPLFWVACRTQTNQSNRATQADQLSDR